MNQQKEKPGMNLGWAQANITPKGPTLVAGLFHARLSEKILDPLTATAWAIESRDEHTVFVSCDLIEISDELREGVFRCLANADPKPIGLDPAHIVLHATHTHTAPLTSSGTFHSSSDGLNLEAVQVSDYVAFAAEQIAHAVIQAWSTRAPGGIAFGQEFAAIGFNRRWVNADGRATMYGPEAQQKQREAANAQNGESSFYGIDSAAAETLRHIEGYDDHCIQLVAAYDLQGVMTGIVVNVPCPAQESENEFAISADWWHETRCELRRRFGEHLYVLPQCGAAGDLSPHHLVRRDAYARMLALKGRTARSEIAHQIANALAEALPHLSGAIEWNPVLKHRTETVELDEYRITEADVQQAEAEAARWRDEFEAENNRLMEKPELRSKPRWYVDVTYAKARMILNQSIIERYNRQKERPIRKAELHAIRLGDIVFATQPFECYLDFGLQIQARSPGLQTFNVQLAGSGTYLPSPRSVQGGGYGSTPASNPVGPEGGQQLVEHTVRMLHSLFT